MSSTAGASTYSKSENRFPSEYPKIAKRAFGCTIIDEHDNAYTDYTSSLGAITLGYNRMEVNDAVISQINKGNIFSIISDIEPIAGDFITEYTKTEKCLFLKTGTDSTNAAIKLSRAFTGNDKILFCSNGYHGWGDWFGASQPISKGTPFNNKSDISSFKYDDLNSLESALIEHHPGTVIMEPIVSDYPTTKDYLNKVVSLVHDYNALLISDEMVAFPRSGEDLFFKQHCVDADLYCIGKGISNGYSFSAVVGNGDILKQRQNEEVFISGTMFGETIGMVAAMKTLEIANQKNLSGHIWKMGSLLQEKFNNLAEEKNVPISLYGLAPRLIFKYPDNNIKSLFLQETANQRLIFGNIVYCNMSHTQKVIDDTIKKCDEVLDNIALAIENDTVEESIIGRLGRDLSLRK